jgi:hypothetical protein
MYLDQAGMALLQLMEGQRVDVVLLQSDDLARLVHSSPQQLLPLPEPTPNPWAGPAELSWGLHALGPYSAAAAGATAGGGGGGGAAIIVFVVLITEDTVHNANGIVVVNQMAHQLPLGVAHFHFDHAAAATARPQGVTSRGRPPHALFLAGQRHIAKDFARLQNKRSSSGGGGGGGSSSSSSSSGGGGGGGGGFTHPCPTCKSIVGCGCRSSSSSSSSSSRPTKKRRLSLPPAASRK